jgi:hypothetical protein
MRGVELKNIVFAAAATAGDAAFIEVKPTGNISLADVKQSRAVVKDEVLRNGLVFTERGCTVLARRYSSRALCVNTRKA